MGNWEDLQVKYMWMTRGENCGICDAMAGRVYTYDTWISAGVLPGFHLHCNCYLKKVADDTPESDRDVFGSDFDIMLDNHYILSLNTNPGWLPYNRYFSQEVEKSMLETGQSIGQALKSLTNQNQQGLFNKSTFKAWDQFFQWRVFRSLRLKQNADGTLSDTLSPTVKIPRVYYPCQTYHSLCNWD